MSRTGPAVFRLSFRRSTRRSGSRMSSRCPFSGSWAGMAGGKVRGHRLAGLPSGCNAQLQRVLLRIRVITDGDHDGRARLDRKVLELLGPERVHLIGAEVFVFPIGAFGDDSDLLYGVLLALGPLNGVVLLREAVDADPEAHRIGRVLFAGNRRLDPGARHPNIAVLGGE